MIIEGIAEVRRTSVGDSYVSEELQKWGDFGGEPSGAWIFPKISLCPDGPYAAALFCEIASEWDVASELDAMPAYPILRESFVRKCTRRLSHRLVHQVRQMVSGLPMMMAGTLSGQAGPNRRSVSPPKENTLQKAKEMLSMGRDRIQQGKTA